MNKLSRDIKGIIYKYITISKERVKRNYNLVIYNIGNVNRKFVNVCYCPFCDILTNYAEFHYYTLDKYFENNYSNTKYLFNKCYPCFYCFKTCLKKYDLLESLKKI